VMDPAVAAAVAEAHRRDRGFGGLMDFLSPCLIFIVPLP
jgi:hypothetical protein